MTEDFKELCVRGKVVDLAGGVIIGAGFGKIVESVMNDLIMPSIGAIIGKLDFTNLFVVRGKNPENLVALADLKKAGIPVLAYGSFITVAVNFTILAFIIFMMVKQINRLKRSEAAPVPAPPAPTPEDVVLLREIRDALKK